MTVSATLDKTVRLYRTHFAPLLAISAVTAAVDLPMMWFLSDPDGELGWRTAIWMMASILVVLPIEMGALARASLDILHGRPVKVWASYRAALRRYPALAGSLVLTFLGSAIGFVFFVVPGLVVLFGFGFIGYVIMGEDLGMRAAMSRSWRLADGLRGRMLLIVLVLGILQFILAAAFAAALELVPALGLPKLDDHLASLLLTPCFALAFALLFHGLRIDREGYDLALEARRLADERARAADAQATT